jgi:hypothetical protein
VQWDEAPIPGADVFVAKLVNEEAAGPLHIPPAALGMAVTDGRGCGRVVYLVTDRIERLAERNQLTVAVILGSAMAHELGHLLLPSQSHAPRGLMRADWNRGDLVMADGRGLRFTPQQGQQIRARLRRQE